MKPQHPPIREHEVKAGLCRAMRSTNVQSLAQFAGYTDDAARLWKEGKRCPNAAALINLAREVPEVATWLREQLGWK